MNITIIASIDNANVIGLNNSIPWKIREDIAHFKKTTIGHSVLMGRKTYDSIGGMLKDRLNIVLTRDTNKTSDDQNLLYVNSFDDALDIVKAKYFSELFIIGGGEVFKQFIDKADKLIISHIAGEHEGDVFFPAIDENKWLSTEIISKKDFVITTYRRTSQ
ncbi:MAG: dihydrofolate reductase [Melioribacteraceae bacterium]|nr:dihydrofolate reductase [Melioribacteraceae bacterium]